MTNTLNEDLWLSSKLSIPNMDSLGSILNFTFFWNLFEAKHFNFHYSPSKIDNFAIIHSDNFTNIFFETNEILLLFITRYYQDNLFTHDFYTLNLRSNDKEPLIKEVLKGEKTNKNDIIKTIIIIIGRFRNNLFHGLKEPREIICQNDLFASINKYLSLLIDF